MSNTSPPAIKLAVCVTFHFVRDRFQYLEALCKNFSNLAREVDVTIVTNTVDSEEQKAILRIGDQYGLNLSLFVPTGLGHPYLLPWSHFPVMREKFLDPAFTHFLYQEDDMLVRQETVIYLLEARELLRAAGLLPAIVRVEKNSRNGEWYVTDEIKPVELAQRSMVRVEGGPIGFVNLFVCYQAMYFLDRECMARHLSGDSSNPNAGMWHIRERASQALTFVDVPEGFRCRYVVPMDIATKRLDERCMVHHLPNNYVFDPKSLFAKLWLGDLFE